MLWDTKYMRVTRKGDIECNSFRTSGLAVGVATKGFLPPCALIFSSLFLLCSFRIRFFTFFLLLFLLLIDLCSPVLHVQEALLVELNLGLTVSLELDAEWRVPDDSLVLAALAIDNLGVSLLGLCVQGSALGDLQASYQRPIASLVVSLLPRLAIVSEIDIALCPLLFIEGDSCDAGIEKRDSKRETSLLLAGVYSLEHNTIQLAILEGD